MSFRPTRKLRKSIAHSSRVLFTALMAASLLLGLIPPPAIEGVVTSVVTHVVPTALAEPLEELLAPSVASAEELYAPRLAPFSTEVTLGQAIPDNSCPTNTEMTISVTDNFTIDDLNVGLTIDHPYRSDIDVSLRSPNGTSVTLFTDIGGSGNNFDILLDDEVGTDIGSLGNSPNHTIGTSFYENGYNLEGSGSLNAFDGENASGDWKLVICDDANGDIGSVERIFLEFDGTSVITSSPGEINGTVFRDYDANATNESGESGIENVVVTAYDANGNSASTTTDANGNYTILASNGGPAVLSGEVHIEFTLPGDGSLDYLHPGTAGDGSPTTVQFADIDAGATIHASFNNPSDYCESNPAYAVACYMNGVPTDASNVGEPAIARFVYNDRGEGSPASKDADTNINDVGSVWGLAYDSSGGNLYMSTLLKRHAGLIEDGGGNPLIGAIYIQTDPTNSSTVSLFYDFGAAAGNDIPTNATRFPSLSSQAGPANTQRSVDGDVFPMIGKRGFGDMDISDDGRTLYVVNLFDRELYTLNTLGTPAHAEVANAPWIDNSICPTNPDSSASGVARPWATKYSGGSIYVGVVCDASTSDTCDATNSCDDLTAHIFAHDGTSRSPTLPAPIDLSYERDLQGYSSAGEYWHPWTDTYSDIDQYVTGGIRKYPEPILGDIEFADDGSIMLGFIDRVTHQFGYDNSEPDVVSPNTDVSIFSAGDILRVGFDAAGTTLTLENNGQVYDSSGTLLTGSTTTSPSGPGGREFYDDRWNSSGAATAEADTSIGSLALLPGSGEVLYTSADRYSYYSAAVSFASNIDGSHTGGVTVYQDDGSGSVGTFS